MADWTVGRGEGHTIRIEVVRDSREGQDGFTAHMFDDAADELIGSGMLFTNAHACAVDAHNLVQAWWPGASSYAVKQFWPRDGE